MGDRVRDTQPPAQVRDSESLSEAWTNLLLSRGLDSEFEPKPELVAHPPIIRDAQHLARTDLLLLVTRGLDSEFEPHQLEVVIPLS